MILKVYPKRGCAVRDPLTTPVHGGLPRRVGMVPVGEEPTGQVAEFDEATAAGLQIVRHLRKDELVPADEATARAAGIPFVELEVGKDNWAAPKTKAVAAPKGDK